MKPRHMLMGVGVVITGWLAFFGDKTPSATVAEPSTHEKTSATKATVRPIIKSGIASSITPMTTPVITPDSAAGAALPLAPATSGTPRKEKTKPEPTILVLRERAALIGNTGDFKQGDAIFASQSWVPPPPPPPKPVAPPPPTAPALPFTFIGKKLEDAVWEVYLSKDDHTFIVREKSVIDTNYRVESIKPPTLTLTYLPLNQMQTLTIGGAD